MRKSQELQKPLAIAFGGACLLGLGLNGCAKDSLDVAKQDARSNSAIAERANESILRSRQELAGKDGKDQTLAKTGGLIEADSEFDERPSLASRWTKPFRSAGNLLRRKSDDAVGDPFMAQADVDHDAATKAKKEKDSIAALAEEKALAAKPAVSSSKSEKAETQAKSALAAGKSSAESRGALEEFLATQQPVDLDNRAQMASYESDPLTRKPGTKTNASQAAKERTVADATRPAPGDEAVAPEHRVLGKAAVAAATPGKARPFPADFEPEEPAAPTSKATSRLRQNVATAAPKTKNPLAAEKTGKLRRNPLLDDAEVATASPLQEQDPGDEIAGLLKQAKSAGNQGEFRTALKYAVAAKDLAQQCSYEFSAGEQSPDEMVDWLSDKLSEAEQLAHGRHDRRQLAAASGKKSPLRATQTGFATPSAEEVFGQDVEAAAARQKSAVAAAPRRPQPEADSSFNEWASGVGTRPIAKGRAPEWPVLSSSELAQSNELWQPSRSGVEHLWSETPALTSSSQLASSLSTRLASAESDAPAFVATADARSVRPSFSSPRSADPLVELGRPTDIHSDSDEDHLARHGSTTTKHRGPRLSAPPPLSIESGEETAPAQRTAHASSRSRLMWFAMIGGLSVIVLVAFRRWAYRIPTAVESK